MDKIELQWNYLQRQQLMFLGGNVLHMNIPVVSSTPITETETTEAETRSPGTFLPNVSPSGPTATATCRP